MNIKCIGIGGVGCLLISVLCRFLAFQSAGKQRISITLIDGDGFEPKNKERQSFKGQGNKAEVKEEELKEEFPQILLSSVPEFIDRFNIENIIKEGDIVFLMVDNHKTRKLVSEYCCRLRDIVLISGGCELTDGTVQVYVRSENQDRSFSLTHVHPEIESPADRSPAEMVSCDELSASSGPQLLFTNLTVAAFMLNAFYVIWIKQKPPYNEVYFDIMEAKTRVIEIKERREERKK